jgi:hypothetical protein
MSEDEIKEYEKLKAQKEHRRKYNAERYQRMRQALKQVEAQICPAGIDNPPVKAE